MSTSDTTSPPIGYDGPRGSGLDVAQPATGGLPAGLPAETHSAGLPLQSAPVGLPDSQLMAAWANEFFRAVGQAPSAGVPVQSAGVPAPPVPADATSQLPAQSSWQVPIQVPVVAPQQLPPLGPDPSPAGYYFLEQSQLRRAVPTNPEPYTRPLTAASGPVPRAPAFTSQPLTSPSGAPPTNAALANGVPLAAHSGALPIMAGSGEPAWALAQPALAGVPGVGGLGAPPFSAGFGAPPPPDPGFAGLGGYGTTPQPSAAGPEVPGFASLGLPAAASAGAPATPRYTNGAAPAAGSQPFAAGAELPGFASLGLPGLPAGASAPAWVGLPQPSAAGLGWPAANPPSVPNSGFGGLPGVPALPGAGFASAPSVSGADFAGLLQAPLAEPTASASASPFEFTPLIMPDEVGRRQFDVESIRRDFPILREIIHGKRLVWLDNAATTQKPQSVIDRISSFYEHENSNIHRAAHALAARSTDAYEGAREAARRFLNAPSVQDIVFVRGTTEAVNLVAQSWGRKNLQPGDEIVITWLEHHSNIVPWQQLCSQTGARLKVAPVDDDGQVLLDEYERLFTSRTRLASFTQVSNALGSVLPVKEMTQIAHRHGARVLVDGAQAVSHMRVDVQAIDCDFYAFSGHKVFGPTGIGVLYGKSDVLAAMPPWQGGGSMIVDVMFDKTVYAAPPARFEAGTGNIADAVGLGAAIEYVERIGMENIARHEHELLEYGTAKLLTVPRLRLIGTAAEKAGVLGFVIAGVPTEQIGAHLAKEGIAVRAGHHCAQPALRRFGLEATVRPSLALYNNRDDIDALVDSLLRLQNNWH